LHFSVMDSGNESGRRSFWGSSVFRDESLEICGYDSLPFGY